MKKKKTQKGGNEEKVIRSLSARMKREPRRLMNEVGVFVL
jgi:hypothetical protein